jgi:AbrB family looped-hinge helix DNA binding protein
MSYNYYLKLNTKGQITIPVEIRNNLNLLANSKLELIKHDNYLILTAINNNLTKLRNSLPKPSKALSCDQINDIITKI